MLETLELSEEGLRSFGNARDNRSDTLTSLNNDAARCSHSQGRRSLFFRRVVVLSCGLVMALSAGACQKHGHMEMYKCDMMRDVAEEVMINQTNVTDYTILNCFDVPEYEGLPTVTVKATLQDESHTSDATALAQQLQHAAISHAPTNAVSSLDEIFLEATWTNTNTEFAFKAVLGNIGPSQQCYTDAQSADSYAGKPSIHRIEARCRDIRSQVYHMLDQNDYSDAIIVDHGEVSSFPEEFVAQRSDFPESMMLFERATIGPWQINGIITQGWQLPSYPYDDMFTQATEPGWYNTTREGKVVPAYVLIQIDPEASTEAGHTRYSLIVDNLNGPDRDLDIGASGHIEYFTEEHPLFSQVFFCYNPTPTGLATPDPMCQ